MRTFRVDGIVIKRQNIGEADRILTVLTKEFGKIQVKAKGVRKITSKRASHIEPLNICSLSLYKGQNMPILTECVSLENFSELKEDLSKIGFAYHLCELVDGLCPANEENKEIFFLLVDVLKKMKTEVFVSNLIYNFEMDLLVQLGYWSISNKLQKVNTSYLIEGILERRLKTKQLIARLA
ncbi:MAG TPA: DNA repair protein RecO [Patescibacteria group bacterium]